MTLKAKVSEEEYAKLDERIKLEYVKGEDDFFYPDIESQDGWSFENVEALKRTKNDERQRREEWEKKAKQLEKQFEGIDPKEAKKLAIEVERLKASQTEGSEAQAKKLKELEDEYSTKLREAIDERDGRIKSQEAELKTLKLTKVAEPLWRKLKCIEPSLFEHEVVKFVKEDAHGNFLVLDEHGEPRQTQKKGAMGNMQLDEFFETFKKRYPQNFEGSRATGGGEDPTGAGGDGFSSELPDFTGDFKKVNPLEALKTLRSQGT